METSELEASAKLKVTRATESGCHLAERVIRQRRVRNGESWCVHKVEGLSTNLKLHSFPNSEFLAEREVDVVHPIASQIRKVTWRIACDLVAGAFKAINIENAGSRGSSLMVADAGRNLRTSNIRALGAIGEISTGNQAERRSCLESENGRSRPASDDSIENRVHIATNPPSTANWNVDDGGESHAMRSVIGANRAFRLQVVQSLRVSRAEARSNKRVCSGGRIINGFRERVVALKADVVAGALLKPDLQ